MDPDWQSRFPAFPWDSIAAAKAKASKHSDGLVDLSIGTPIDKVPNAVRAALAAGCDTPGYPTTHGKLSLRRAYSGWLQRTHEVPDLDPEAVLPTIGSKELVATLPLQLGLGAGDVVAIPELAYPTYEVGAIAAGCAVVRGDTPSDYGNVTVALRWINSPSNPTGAVTSAAGLRETVAWARANNTILVSDECYIDLGWDAHPLSILNPEICGKDHSGLLVAHSLSKRSNMAGYRVGFLAGDPDLVAKLLQIRKQFGSMVPSPMQAAAIAALDDDGHVIAQRSRYAGRREVLIRALGDAGFQIDHSEAGLYLWCTRGEDAMKTVDDLAEMGILVAPGTFYGPAGSKHVRVALTAKDERIAAAVQRLAA
ncbi:succinyldiaminopimelate transaminase [Nakamurella antarctica]|uniref:Aminotransferase n=1 Tax=Nakamurella antarctica TaxID=1902245 RepID=A0A3G8ZQ67_9ACTN|nr:succinyldiaminopimelate transaminase [Nakamurella antarctica]AZI59379.1 succinyldiaminopimelate transaminase [Nakamurella antarctica]